MSKCWNHSPGKGNPADVPSRGLTPLELSVSVLWGTGPDWLSDGGVIEELLFTEMPEKCVTEMKAAERKEVHSLLMSNSTTGLGELMRCEDYSSLL